MFVSIQTQVCSTYKILRSNFERTNLETNLFLIRVLLDRRFKGIILLFGWNFNYVRSFVVTLEFNNLTFVYSLKTITNHCQIKLRDHQISHIPQRPLHLRKS